MTLNYGVDGVILNSVDYDISAGDGSDGDMIRTYWAQKKVQCLEALPEKNRAELLSTGQTYGLVTPVTSLIVLERLDQYVQYEIPPPESLPEMREQYYDAIEDENAYRVTKKEDKLNYVIDLWEKRKNWWRTYFYYPKDFVYDPDKPMTSTTVSTLAAELGVSPMLRGATISVMPLAAQIDGSGDVLLNGAVPRTTAAYDVVVEETSGAGDKSWGEGSSDPSISIQPWDPDTPYLDALKAAKPGDYFDVYMDQRASYAESPAFYLDCATFFFNAGKTDLAVQVLSNIVELELDDAALLRVAAHKLAQENQLDLSKMLFEEVLEMRPEEPQSYRDLALVLEQLGEYEKAMDLLAEVVMGDWDRFFEIEVIALMELNRTYRLAKENLGHAPAFPLDQRLLKLLDTDLRIVLTWDADLTDMDIWVIEPSGEKAYYGNRLTTIGGARVDGLHQGVRTRGVHPESRHARSVSAQGQLLRFQRAERDRGGHPSTGCLHRLRTQ